MRKTAYDLAAAAASRQLRKESIVGTVGSGLLGAGIGAPLGYLRAGEDDDKLHAATRGGLIGGGTGAGTFLGGASGALLGLGLNAYKARDGQTVDPGRGIALIAALAGLGAGAGGYTGNRLVANAVGPRRRKGLSRKEITHRHVNVGTRSGDSDYEDEDDARPRSKEPTNDE